MAGADKRVPKPAPGVGDAPNVHALPWQGSAERLLSLAREAAPPLAELIHDRFADDIHRVVYRVLGPDAEHEDVVQQTFVEILRHVHRVRDAAKLQSWVLAVAVNTARGQIRRRKLKFWQETSHGSLEDWAGIDEAASRELVLRTYEILRRLATDDRVAFTLRYLEGYQVREVAELTRASLATVHRRLARAEAEFRRRALGDELLRSHLRRCELEEAQP